MQGCWRLQRKWSRWSRTFAAWCFQVTILPMSCCPFEQNHHQHHKINTTIFVIITDDNISSLLFRDPESPHSGSPLLPEVFLTAPSSALQRSLELQKISILFWPHIIIVIKVIIYPIEIFSDPATRPVHNPEVSAAEQASHPQHWGGSAWGRLWWSINRTVIITENWQIKTMWRKLWKWGQRSNQIPKT